MKLRLLRVLPVLLIAQLAPALSRAQTVNPDGNESKVHADLRREWLDLHPCRKELVKPCSEFTFGHLSDIGQTLVLGQPLHIALGSLAPQNGFATGLAFTEHKEFADGWRFTTDTDAVASTNLSWRAGSYLTGYRIPHHDAPPVVVFGTPKPGTQTVVVENAPIFNLYAETVSLNRIFFYGLGPNTLPAAKSAFGLTQTIAGVSAIVPLNHADISFTGEFNGRVPHVRGNFTENVPSTTQLYTESTAPGLTRNAAFLQPGLGIQVQPHFFNDRIRLHYLANAQSFSSIRGTPYSFRRWTADIGQEFAIHRKSYLTAADPHNGPDSCGSVGSPCPHISSTINNEGSVSFRMLLSGSAASAGNAVPFYFDPTSGGSNIDGNPILASYPDYRFRSPNLVLLRGTVEHSLPKLPLGIYFSADAAKSPLTRRDIDFTSLRQTYSVGLTVHAGGLPLVYLLFAWGGNEGTHTSFTISNTLLGASPRPSLF